MISNLGKVSNNRLGLEVGLYLGKYEGNRLYLAAFIFHHCRLYSFPKMCFGIVQDI